jgi:hypothetical protein
VRWATGSTIVGAVEAKVVERVAVGEVEIGAGYGEQRTMQVWRERGPEIDDVAARRVSELEPSRVEEVSARR